MKTRSPALSVTLAAFALLLATATAQTAVEPVRAGAAAPAPDRFDAGVASCKQPANWLKLGGDFRVRNEYYNNIITLDERAPLHEQDVIRYRGRVWGTATASPDVAVNARLAFESRDWRKPSFVGVCRGQTGGEARYAIFDTLNVKWTRAFNQPMTLTIGRQDILIGDFYDWWLFADGTPGDGSWTFFVDAARLSIEAKDLKTKFDLIYLYHDARPNGWIHTIGSSANYPQTDQDEQGVALYASNTSLKDAQLDGYLIYKNDRRRTFLVQGVRKTPGDDADIGTVGGKLTGTPAPHWQYSLEAAWQFGSKHDRIQGVTTRRDLRAYGGKGKLSYLVKDSRRNQFSFAGEVLSGDDPATRGKDEMFDVLWGRWPRWSELYIYSYINETSGRVAQVNNVGRLELGWSVVPVKGTHASVTYNSLFALEQTPTRALAPALFSGSGRFRGHYVQALLKQQFGKYLSGHVWGEWIWQGDYYARRDLLTFFRAELMASF